MKDICQALYEYLSGQKEIASQVGARIYPIVLPQDAPLPSIVCKNIQVGKGIVTRCKGKFTGFPRRYVRFTHPSRVYKIRLRVRCKHILEIFNG